MQIVTVFPLQALEDDETLQELCLSWHLQQKQHTRWVPVELQRHRWVGDDVKCC